MTLDERELNRLIELSKDTQSDSMRSARASLPDLASYAQEREETDPEENERFAARRRFLRQSLVAGGGVAAAGALGATLIGVLEVPAWAATSSPDVMILQTAASIEKLAVNTYTTALTLPYIGGSSANGVVKAFVTTTVGQHQAHFAAFNQQATALGGAAQNNPDPAYVGTVNSTVASLTGLTDAQALAKVVSLAMTLETVAAETYVADVTSLSSPTARQLMASIMGVEAQHVAVLAAVSALLAANAASDIA
ncbi:MAG: ferritin-like domain-containing protein, partial [Acidimicrobiales bacterium]